MLARHNRIANERIFAKCAQLDDAGYWKKRAGSCYLPRRVEAAFVWRWKSLCGLVLADEALNCRAVNVEIPHAHGRSERAADACIDDLRVLVDAALGYQATVAASPRVSR
jgi:hypothetical protein